MSIELTDSEYLRLIEIPKEFLFTPLLPTEIEKKSYAVRSKDGKENFLLTAERNIIFELSKSKINSSYSREPIFRVEYNCRPHMNPDGTIIGRNHVHVYKAGYGMGWAYPLETFDAILFKKPADFNMLFLDFCSYCHIGNIQFIQGVISCCNN